MKLVIRAVVVVLVLTGAAASTQITSASAKVTIAKNSAMPTPMCAPDDPNACGLR